MRFRVTTLLGAMASLGLALSLGAPGGKGTQIALAVGVGIFWLGVLAALAVWPDDGRRQRISSYLRLVVALGLTLVGMMTCCVALGIALAAVAVPVR